MNLLDRALTVSSTDPDEARRQKLLNILLVGVGSIVFVGLLVATYLYLLGQLDNFGLIQGTVATLASILIAYLVNRYISGTVASTLFLLVLIAIFSFVDEPRQVVEGRSTFLFTIPILMASVILRPWASFLMAGLTSGVIATVALISLEDYAQGAPPIPSMLGFFAFAFVSWLSARSLENALDNVRQINRELDQRVEDRTRELQDANEQLASANRQLRELDRLKSRFVSMVSHELRTPLSAIQGFAEMLLAEIYGPLSERQEGALDRITTNTNRLLYLVNDLLDQARIEAGQISLQVKPFSPRELAEEFRSTMDVLAQSKGVTLTTEVDPAVPDTIYGDEERLHQIMVNIANNAIKFTDEGSVRLRIYQPDGAEGPASSWVIECSDTGPGISEEDQATIFEPFQRVDDSRTREHLGVGLGLAIVKELVDLMEGDIELESEMGVGSTFAIRLPVNTTGGKDG